MLLLIYQTAISVDSAAISFLVIVSDASYVFEMGNLSTIDVSTEISSECNGARGMPRGQSDHRCSNKYIVKMKYRIGLHNKVLCVIGPL